MKTGFFFLQKKSNICEVVGVWCEISDCPDQILDIIATPTIQTSPASTSPEIISIELSVAVIANFTLLCLEVSVITAIEKITTF